MARVTLAVLLAVLALPVHTPLRRRPADLGLAPDGAPARPEADSRSAQQLAPPAKGLAGMPLGMALCESGFWRLTLTKKGPESPCL